MEPIKKLYDADNRAVELNSNGRRFYYTFNNPFAGYIYLDRDFIILTGDEIINFSDEAEKRKFKNFLYPTKNSQPII